MDAAAYSFEPVSVVSDEVKFPTKQSSYQKILCAYISFKINISLMQSTHAPHRTSSP
jgi:hypothetical protein